MAVDDSYTKSLLHFDGANTSTTFTDESGKTWTARVNSQLTTADKVFGTASGVFDGASWIDTPTHTDFFLSNLNWTWDFRVKFTAVVIDYIDKSIVFQGYDEWNYFTIYWDGDYSFRCQCTYEGNIWYFYTEWTPVVDTWYHIEVSRNGDTPQIFIDGVSQTIVEVTTIAGKTGYDYNSIMRLGSAINALYFTGKLDEVRFSPGIARHTTNFTLPTSPYGSHNITKGNYVSLPATDSDLETAYSAQDITDIATKDDTRVTQLGAAQYIIHQFKNDVTTNTFCNLEWQGQTSLAPSSSTVYLQIYNRNTTTWDNVDSDNSSSVNTDFTLSGSVPDLTDYKDSNNVISCRIYQQAL